MRSGFQVLGAIVVLVGGLLVACWCGSLVGRWLERYPVEPPIRQLVVRVARLTVLRFAVVVALDKFGFRIAPLVAGIGVAGLGVGIATHGVLPNVVARLTIIFTKPFREYIEVTGVHGDVTTSGAMRQRLLALTVAHGADLTATLRLADEIVRANPRVLKDPPPIVRSPR